MSKKNNYHDLYYKPAYHADREKKIKEKREKKK